MRRRRLAIALAVAAVVLTVATVVLPGVIAQSVARRLSQRLGTAVHLGWLSWNPLAGRWVLNGVRIAAEEGPPAFTARRITAELRLFDLLRGDQRARLLMLEGARLRLRATPGGWELPLPAVPPEEAGEGLTLAVDWLGAPRAVVRLEPRRGIRSLLRLRQLELTGAIGPETTRATLWTRGRLDRGSLACVGSLHTSSEARRVRFRLAATGLDLARTLRLAETPVHDLRGRVDLRAKYEEAGRDERVRRSVTGSASGRDLALRAAGMDGLWLREFTLARFAVDLERRAVALGPVRVRGGEVWVRRAGSRLIIPGLLDAEPPRPDGTAPQWTLTIAHVDLARSVLHHIDAESGEQTIDVSLKEASLGPVGAVDAPVPFSVGASLGSGGELSAHGELTQRPPRLRAGVELTGVVLGPLAALTGMPLRLSSGHLSGSGQVAFADGALQGSGTLALADLKTLSPDPARPEDVMAFKDLRLEVRRARTDPPSVELEQVEIGWPYVLVDRSTSGIFPFSVLSGTASSQPPAVTPPVRIDRLRVVGGRIDFRDTTIEPSYWRALARLGLEGEHIEAPALRVADLHASGLVDEITPLRVEGTIGTRTRLVAEVERLALPPFNAYLAGTAPYTVLSGVLTARSEITLERSQLEVNNRVVLSRLGLSGSRGPDAVQREIGIPLTLALALMKDYRGNIELALPFGGKLNEPTFELRSVIRQAIVRAVRNAILSPLNALGRVLLRDGRIENVALDPIPFATGARELDDAGRERVAQVARVLQTRPELAVRLRGLVACADLERVQDETALSALVDDPTAEPLRAFLRARLAGQPLPALTDAQRVRLDALLAGLQWPGSALYDLATDRGAVAAAALILDQRLEPERVSADTPDSPQPERLAPAPGASVELRER